MQRKRLADVECSIARTLDVVGDWWTLMIVRDLFAFKGHYRFDEIQHSLGISRNILADRLAALCEHGVAERRPYQDRPPGSSTASRARDKTCSRWSWHCWRGETSGPQARTGHRSSCTTRPATTTHPR